MKCIEGIWLPDGDMHFVKMLPAAPKVDGKATYQINKYRAALAHVKHRGHAVDVGGHVGLWSRIMAMDFERVTAFEPLAAHRECFAKNVTAQNVSVFGVALGAPRGTIRIHMPHDNTGHSHVREDGEECLILPLDEALSAYCIAPDFLKIDVEGFEYEVIASGEQSIRAHRPVMVVEQKANNAERYGRGRWDAVKLLKDWGMKEAQVISGDHVMIW